MYKICQTAKSEECQRQFQDALLEMMKTQNFNRITIISLCKKLEVSRKTFYQYFDTLEDVLNAVLDHELKNSFLFFEGELEIRQFFYYWKERKWLLDLLQKNELSHLLIIRSYKNLFFDRKSLDLTTTEIKYVGGLSGMISILIFWNLGKMKQSPEEMEEMVCETFNIADLSK